MDVMFENKDPGTVSGIPILRKEINLNELKQGITC